MRTLLRLKAIDSRQEWRDFWCELSCLEAVFEVLNFVVREGSTLLEASITEDRKVTQLPIDAFTGESFIEAIRELEQEWKGLLSEPINYYNKHELALLLARRLDQQNDKNRIHQRVIDRFSYLVQRTESSIQREPQRSRILSNHNRVITVNRIQLAKGLLNATLVERRIQKLFIV